MEKEITKIINKDKTLERERAFWPGFYAGFTIVLVTGLGDKLFFLNMIYASMNSFFQSFWIILAISEIMNLVNISLGHLLKKYLNISILQYIAIAIFIILGVCLIIKGMRMPERRLIQNYEEERQLLINNQKNQENKENDKEEDNNNINNYQQIEVLEKENNDREMPIGVFDSWWKYFITYFFASIGEKSQIASILLVTKYNYISIFNGSAIAIIFLVFIAMIFGKSISRLLTNKQISIICGILFLLYAIVFFIDTKGEIIFKIF